MAFIEKFHLLFVFESVVEMIYRRSLSDTKKSEIWRINCENADIPEVTKKMLPPDVEELTTTTEKIVIVLQFYLIK